MLDLLLPGHLRQFLISECWFPNIGSNNAINLIRVLCRLKSTYVRCVVQHLACKPFRYWLSYLLFDWWNIFRDGQSLDSLPALVLMGKLHLGWMADVLPQFWHSGCLLSILFQFMSIISFSKDMWVRKEIWLAIKKVTIVSLLKRTTGVWELILILSQKITFTADNFRQYTDMVLDNMESHNEKLFSFHSFFISCDSVRERLRLVLVFNL